VVQISLSEQSNMPQPSEAWHLASTHHPIAQTPAPQPQSLPCSSTNSHAPHQSNNLFIHFNLTKENCQVIKDLLTKAWQFSCRAKCFSGDEQRQTYQQKGLALSQAIELFPQGFRVLSLDVGAGKIGLLPPTGPRLHCLLQDLTVSAKQLLASQVLKLFNM
jgi:hypothetical protein